MCSVCIYKLSHVDPANPVSLPDYFQALCSEFRNNSVRSDYTRNKSEELACLFTCLIFLSWGKFSLTNSRNLLKVVERVCTGVKIGLTHYIFGEVAVFCHLNNFSIQRMMPFFTTVCAIVCTCISPLNDDVM